MASETFNRFLSQLHAEGREKEDGFDYSHFDGLAADERPLVRNVLAEALLDGDSTAARGLLLLDATMSVPVLERALEQRRYPNQVGLTDGFTTVVAVRGSSRA